MSNRNQTVVICIGDRSFYGFGKGRPVKTAWSLGGALLFQIGCNNDLDKIFSELCSKGKSPVIREVSLGSPVVYVGGAL